MAGNPTIKKNTLPNAKPKLGELFKPRKFETGCNVFIDIKTQIKNMATTVINSTIIPIKGFI